jgi:hypothetical protein
MHWAESILAAQLMGQNRSARSGQNSGGPAAGSAPGACTAQGATAWHDLGDRPTQRKANNERGRLTSGRQRSCPQLAVRGSTANSGEPARSGGCCECTVHEEKGRNDTCDVAH